MKQGRFKQGKEMAVRVFLLVLAIVASQLSTAAVAVDACPSTDKPIATDRPDVTNSSVVIPVGSFQNENGINVTSGGHFGAIDGTNSRLRFGVAPCLEVLIDVPNYQGGLHRATPSGFGDVAPAIKWQISPAPASSTCR